MTDMDHLYSKNEATLSSVFDYASSSSSDEDVDMIDSESNSNTSFMPTQVSKRGAESDPDSSPKGRQTKRLRMTSPSSSITTSGPSSPTSPLKEASQPYLSVSRGFYVVNYEDDRSESYTKRKAKDEPTVEPSKGSMKRVKPNPLAKPFYPTSSPTSSPTPPHRSIFVGGLWRCCQCSSTDYFRSSRRVSSCDSCEHVKCEECDKKTADQLKRERGNMVAPMIRAAGEDKVQNSSWATPSMTRYGEGDPRRRCSKELSGEDMKRILKKGGSQGFW